MLNQVQMTKEEQLDELRPGAHWFASKSGKLVLVLCVTNENTPEKFRERNPQQVVFLTQTNTVISLEFDKFVESHEFYQHNPEAIAVLESVLAGEFAELALGAGLQDKAAEESDEDTGEDLIASDAGDAEESDNTPNTLLRPIDIDFLTINGDTRRAPMLDSESVAELVTSVDQVPVVVMTNGALVQNGRHIKMVFNVSDDDAAALLNSMFDPESVLQHYAAFVLNGETIEPDAFLGLTKLTNRAGQFLQANFVVLDNAEEVEEEQPAEEEQQQAPAAPKTMAQLAAELHAAQQAEAAKIAAAPVSISTDQAVTVTAADTIVVEASAPTVEVTA